MKIRSKHEESLVFPRPSAKPTQRNIQQKRSKQPKSWGKNHYCFRRSGWNWQLLWDSLGFTCLWRDFCRRPTFASLLAMAKERIKQRRDGVLALEFSSWTMLTGSRNRLFDNRGGGDYVVVGRKMIKNGRSLAEPCICSYNIWYTLCRWFRAPLLSEINSNMDVITRFHSGVQKGCPIWSSLVVLI